MKKLLPTLLRMIFWWLVGAYFVVAYIGGGSLMIGILAVAAGFKASRRLVALVQQIPTVSSGTEGFTKADKAHNPKYDS